MTLRDATDADAAILGRLFADAVRTGGPRHYSPAQVEAWAEAAADPLAYGRRVLTGQVLLAEDASGGVGFVAVGVGGHVSALYVRGDRQGRGVGGTLLAEAVRRADAAGAERLHAEASEGSLAMFLGAGFARVGSETVKRGGVTLTRHLVERVRWPLAEGDASGRA